MERINAYEKFLEQEGLPVIRDYSVPDLMTTALKPWARKGGLGAYINLTGSEGIIDAYLCEIPPGGSLLPQRHLYEELIYILSGYGATSVWVEGGEKQSFEWQEGSLFSPPLNTSHQHFNGQSDKPVRYLGVTRAPVFMNLFHDLDFIFHNEHFFKGRYDAEEGYFSSRGKDLQSVAIDNPKIWASNFITDCRTIPLVEDNIRRGGFSRNIRFDLSNNLMGAHISEFVGGTYMHAHHHGPGAHLLCLSGQGYTLMWPLETGIKSEGFQRVKIDWQPGTLLVPPSRWFHQHFSTGKEPARQLAIEPEKSSKFRGIEKDAGPRIAIRLGGREIQHDEEDPEIRRLFKEELAKTGAPWRMGEVFPGE